MDVPTLQAGDLLTGRCGHDVWPIVMQRNRHQPIHAVGIAASYERHRITERTAAGRVQAKARGVKFGRRAALTPHQQAEALQRLAAGDTQRTVAALLGVNQATISRLHRNAVE